MEAEDSGSTVGFHHRGGGGESSESIFKTSNSEDTFYNSSGWDQLVSLNQSENFGGAFLNTQYPIVIENRANNGSSSHMVRHPSDSGLVDMVTKIPSSESGSFSEMVCSFGLPEQGQMAETSHPHFMPRKQDGNAKALPSAHSRYNCQIAEDETADSALNGSRKRRASESHSSLNPNTNVEGRSQKVSSRESAECSKEDERKESVEHDNVSNLHDKQAGKQPNDFNGGEPCKDNYIHVRAKRGQAINSHSLAERVRRERISERMRLLQELVPGCNKITGKAMMLDEIINYVQSLQQQVEFLSMKLATVNPELNIDIERILTKEMLHSRGAGTADLTIAPGLNNSIRFPGIPQGSFAGIPNLTPQYHPLPQSEWENEFQSVAQIGFDSNPSINHLGLNGG